MIGKYNILFSGAQNAACAKRGLFRVRWNYGLCRSTMKGEIMHYRNGREAQNGDKLVKLEGGKVVAFGVLHSAEPGNDYCNGSIAVIQQANEMACMVDCLHVDDVAEMLAEKELAARPEGK